RGLVLDEHRHVVHQARQLRRDPVQRLGDQLLELLACHLQHTAIVVHDPSVRVTPAPRISGAGLGHTGSMARVPAAVSSALRRASSSTQPLWSTPRPYEPPPPLAYPVPDLGIRDQWPAPPPPCRPPPAVPGARHAGCSVVPAAVPAPGPPVSPRATGRGRAP